MRIIKSDDHHYHKTVTVSECGAEYMFITQWFMSTNSTSRGVITPQIQLVKNIFIISSL